MRFNIPIPLAVRNPVGSILEPIVRIGRADKIIAGEEMTHFKAICSHNSTAFYLTSVLRNRLSNRSETWVWNALWKSWQDRPWHCDCDTSALRHAAKVAE